MGSKPTVRLEPTCSPLPSYALNTAVTVSSESVLIAAISFAAAAETAPPVAPPAEGAEDPWVQELAPGSPEWVAREYLIAVRERGFAAEAEFLHPDEMARFKAMLIPVFAAETESGGRALINATFGRDARMSDVRVSDTDSSASDGQMGEGLATIEGARLTGERALLLRNAEVGALAYGAGAELVLSDVAVMQTRERACATTTCRGTGAGIGVGAYGGGHVELTRLLVADGALIGVQVANGTTAAGDPYAVCGTMDLHLGEVTGHVVGANVQDPGFDVRRLTDRIRFDNERNFDSDALPVPAPWAGGGT